MNPNVTSHPNSSFPIFFELYRIPFPHIQSRSIVSHFSLFHCIPWSHCIPSHPTPSYLVPSHDPIPSHFIVSHDPIPFNLTLSTNAPPLTLVKLASIINSEKENIRYTWRRLRRGFNFLQNILWTVEQIGLVDNRVNIGGFFLYGVVDIGTGTFSWRIFWFNGSRKL